MCEEALILCILEFIALLTITGVCVLIGISTLTFDCVDNGHVAIFLLWYVGPSEPSYKASGP